MSPRAIGAMALITLATTLVFISRESWPEWRRYQDNFAAATGTRPAIRQVLLPALDRVDRCTTCHAAPEEGIPGKGKLLEAHPGHYLQWHPVERFGCTACHGGQGVATTYRDAAHTPIPYWDTPMRGPGEIEASCGVCHRTEKVPFAPILSRGRELIRRSNCFGCHKIPGLEGYQPDAPSLDRIGEKLRSGFHTRWLTDPKQYSAIARMPRFRLDQSEMDAIGEFLRTLVGKGFHPRAVPRGDSERGGALFRESRCITCHKVHGKGGHLAPELEHVASKVRPEWLGAFLTDPHSFRPATPMLVYDFTPSEVADLWAYIEDEFTDESATKEPPERAPDPKLAKKGQELFLTLGCSGCHGDPLGRPRVKIGPDLSRVGAKDPETLEFGAARGVRRSVINYLFLKVRNPMFATAGLALPLPTPLSGGAAGPTRTTTGAPAPAGRAARETPPPPPPPPPSPAAVTESEAHATPAPSRMPDYRYGDADCFAIAVALASLNGYSPPADYVIPATPPVRFEPGGEFGQLLSKFRCLTCHIIRGAGANLSTVDLSVEGSRVQKDWLRSYLLMPYSLRPAIEERMPVFRMSAEEANTIADYISKVFVDDAIPDAPVPALTPAEADAGKKLFDERGCIGCHILGKDGGYVGPSLNGTGQRFRSGYVYRWMLTPQTLKPGSRHPDQGFTEEEARALTAYLMQQKAGEWIKTPSPAPAPAPTPGEIAVPATPAATPSPAPAPSPASGGGAGEAAHPSTSKRPKTEPRATPGPTPAPGRPGGRHK